MCCYVIMTREISIIHRWSYAFSPNVSSVEIIIRYRMTTQQNHLREQLQSFTSNRDNFTVVFLFCCCCSLLFFSRVQMKATVRPSICSQSLWAKCSKLFSKESKFAAARPSSAPVFVFSGLNIYGEIKSKQCSELILRREESEDKLFHCLGAKWCWSNEN